jgi:uncharacterized protein (TIGR03067 family)
MRSIPPPVLLASAACVIVCMPIGAVRAADTPEGKWIATGVVRAGKAVIGKDDDFGSITISGDKIEWTEIPHAFKSSGKGAVTFDASKKPATIVLKEGDKTHKGVYRIDGDTLIIVLSDPGGEFPKDTEKVPKSFEGCKITLKKK